jgi:hypothetical protein
MQIKYPHDGVRSGVDVGLRSGDCVVRGVTT